LNRRVCQPSENNCHNHLVPEGGGDNNGFNPDQSGLVLLNILFLHGFHPLLFMCISFGQNSDLTERIFVLWTGQNTKS